MSGRGLAIIIFASAAAACADGSESAVSQSSNPVTVAVVNARVWTGEPARPWAEALAISGDTVAAVGTNDEVRKLAAGMAPIDGGGRLIVPGFIDTHVHFVDGGFRLASVQLRDAANAWMRATNASRVAASRSCTDVRRNPPSTKCTWLSMNPGTTN